MVCSPAVSVARPWVVDAAEVADSNRTGLIRLFAFNGFRARLERSASAHSRPTGSLLILIRDSSTMMTVPSSSSDSDVARTDLRRSITWADRVFLRRNRMMLHRRPFESAAISPKSRSNVRTTRFSPMAFSKMSPFGSRWRPSSRRCVTSRPCSRSQTTMLIGTHMSARNR